MSYKYYIETEEDIYGEVQQLRSLVEYKGEEIGAININLMMKQVTINEFSVNIEHRRKGIGKKLFKKAVRNLKKLGVKELFVEPKSYDLYGDNNIEIEDLYKFYKKIGFKFLNDKPNINKSGESMVYFIISLKSIFFE